MRGVFFRENTTTLALLLVLALTVIAFCVTPTRRAHAQRSPAVHSGGAQPVRAAGERV
jgi:hypothetical protein